VTKSRDFFWKADAALLADVLRRRGLMPMVTPKHAWGPRGCFNWPFGWRVVWFEPLPTGKGVM